MKTTSTIISLSVLLACLTLTAQEPAKPAAALQIFLLHFLAAGDVDRLAGHIGSEVG